eukprot:scaffold145142_cov31-Tisochrysis_lutea.AAC.3
MPSRKSSSGNGAIRNPSPHSVTRAHALPVKNLRSRPRGAVVVSGAGEVVWWIRSVRRTALRLWVRGSGCGSRAPRLVWPVALALAR